MGRQSQRRFRLIDRACALFAKARRIRDEGSLARALHASRRALDLFLAHDGPESPDVAHVLLERSGTFLDLGRYADGLASIEEAILILRAKRTGGDIARLRHQVFIHAGHVQVLHANYAGARKSFSRALRAAESQRLGGHAVARALNGLGMVAKYTGRFLEGERLYRRALRESARAPGANGSLVATVLHNLAGLDHARRRFARAERWARRGLALRERDHGATATTTATDVAALAAIVHARGRHDEAAALYRRSLSTLRDRLGPDHFEVVFNVSQLAALEHARGRLVLSRRLYRQSLPRLERILGCDHPVVARVAANLAELLRTP